MEPTKEERMAMKAQRAKITELVRKLENLLADITDPEIEKAIDSFAVEAIENGEQPTNLLAAVTYINLNRKNKRTKWSV